MGDLPPSPSLPTYISSLSKTVKRKPQIFNCKLNFGWILGQHDILVLADGPHLLESENFFLSEVRFELDDVPPPPTPTRIEKKSLKNEMLIFGLCSTSDDMPSNPSDES